MTSKAWHKHTRLREAIQTKRKHTFGYDPSKEAAYQNGINQALDAIDSFELDEYARLAAPWFQAISEN